VVRIIRGELWKMGKKGIIGMEEQVRGGIPDRYQTNQRGMSE
jgi:hypothetical protein